jgi:hypothetical protein
LFVVTASSCHFIFALAFSRSFFYFDFGMITLANLVAACPHWKFNSTMECACVFYFHFYLSVALPRVSVAAKKPRKDKVLSPKRLNAQTIIWEPTKR